MLPTRALIIISHCFTCHNLHVSILPRCLYFWDHPTFENRSENPCLAWHDISCLAPAFSDHIKKLEDSDLAKYTTNIAKCLFFSIVTANISFDSRELLQRTCRAFFVSFLLKVVWFVYQDVCPVTTKQSSSQVFLMI